MIFYDKGNPIKDYIDDAFEGDYDRHLYGLGIAVDNSIDKNHFLKTLNGVDINTKNNSQSLKATFKDPKGLQFLGLSFSLSLSESFVDNRLGVEESEVTNDFDSTPDDIKSEFFYC